MARSFNSMALIGDDFIDNDIINQLIENDRYLKSVTPTISITYPGGRWATTEGEATGITGGTIVIPKNQKSSWSYTIKFPRTIQLPGPPVLLLTPQIGVPATAYVVKYGAGYKWATVRVALVNSRNKIAGGRLNWALIHGMPTT